MYYLRDVINILAVNTNSINANNESHKPSLKDWKNVATVSWLREPHTKPHDAKHTKWIVIRSRMS